MANDTQDLTPPPEQRSAAEVFAAIGPWAGETTAEILETLADSRRKGGQRSVPDL